MPGWQSELMGRKDGCGSDFHMFLYIPIYLSICLSIYLSVCLSVYLSTYFSFFTSNFPCICPSILPLLYFPLFAYLSISLSTSTYLSVFCLFVYVSITLSSSTYLTILSICLPSIYFIEPAFVPPAPQNIGKTKCFATFLPFRPP